MHHLKLTLTFISSLLLLGCSMKDETQMLKEVHKAGAGGLRLEISSGDRSPPSPLYRTAAMQKRAAPTNQWFSAVMYQRWGDPVYATPLTAKATPEGLEISFPTKEVIPTDRRDVEIHYTHKNDVRITPVAFQPHATLLGNYSDWAADMEMVSTEQKMVATLSHGSPFIYVNNSEGNIKVDFAPSFRASIDTKGRNALIIQNSTKQYAVFAPNDARWVKQSDTEWLIEFNGDRTFMSVAALPNLSNDTLNAFHDSAFTFIENTVVSWKVDEKTRDVHTHFALTTHAKSSKKAPPIIGLYPHHYHNNNNLPSKEIGSLQTIRGPIRLFQTDSFNTHLKNNGFVPIWPGITDEEATDDLQTQLRRDVAAGRRMMLEIGTGPYWQGKGLQRITQLMQVAESQGEMDYRQELLTKVKKRAEKWLSGRSETTYFHYDKKTGTVVSYPEEYDAVLDMNDHHFHYGYWIRAAAEIAMADPDWAEQWGQSIDWLVQDIATAERGSSTFPFLRNFDPYEGHSWASGIARGPHGNNQESSSEAINAWASLMMWGSLRDDPELVALGTYMYNTEIEATRHYWFDSYGLVFPEEYLNSNVCIVFAGKLMHNTWWIDEPRQIHGINFLPLTPSSTYLGDNPSYIKHNLDALKKEEVIYADRGKRADPPDIWQDLFAKYLALADPEAGYERWNQFGSFELGDTRSHALHWLETLKKVGTPVLTITADTPFYAVFNNNGIKTYMAYTYQANKLVTFSDGVQLATKAGSLSVITSQDSQ